MLEWVTKLNEQLGFDDSTGQTTVASIQEDSERNLFLPIVKVTQHGLVQNYILNANFFASSSYEAIISVGEKLTGLIENDAFVQRGERKQFVSSFVEAIDWLMREAQRGQNIQRYKGLGEMNPEQLWETTMDPEVRRMMKVTIEDAISADQIFNTLMGDDVEPRRDFIQSNALSVLNLDI